MMALAMALARTDEQARAVEARPHRDGELAFVRHLSPLQKAHTHARTSDIPPPPASTQQQPSNKPIMLRAQVDISSSSSARREGVEGRSSLADAEDEEEQSTHCRNLRTALP